MSKIQMANFLFMILIFSQIGFIITPQNRIGPLGFRYLTPKTEATPAFVQLCTYKQLGRPDNFAQPVIHTTSLVNKEMRPFILFNRSMD